MPPGNGSIVLGLQIAKCYRTDRRDVSRWVRAWCPVVAGAVFVNLTFEMEPSVSQSTRLSERALFNISTQHDVAGSKRDAGDVGINRRGLGGRLPDHSPLWAHVALRLGRRSPTSTTQLLMYWARPPDAWLELTHPLAHGKGCHSASRTRHDCLRGIGRRTFIVARINSSRVIVI